MNLPKTYEVELKFHLPDAADVTLQLMALGAHRGDIVEQADVYLRHPSRDFEQTHEAFRIRRAGKHLFVTYKGPVIDSQAKVRHEIEIPVGRSADDLDRVRALFVALGFEPVRSVEKTRAVFDLHWEGRDLELAIDAVHDLGNFLEIESLAQDADREAARDVILRLADQLHLTNPERRSYLQLLLEKDAEGVRPPAKLK